MTTKFYIDANGAYLGGFSDGNPAIPPGSTEVAEPPSSADQVWSGSAWIYTKPALSDYLAEYRYNKEVGGITIGGLPIPTDDRSKMLISGAYSKALNENNGSAQKTFKIGGGFVALTNDQIISIALAIATHVQKCFDSEAVVYQQILDDVATTKTAVEEAFDNAYNA